MTPRRRQRCAPHCRTPREDRGAVREAPPRCAAGARCWAEAGRAPQPGRVSCDDGSPQARRAAACRRRWRDPALRLPPAGCPRPWQSPRIPPPASDRRDAGDCSPASPCARARNTPSPAALDGALPGDPRAPAHRQQRFVSHRSARCSHQAPPDRLAPDRSRRAMSSTAIPAILRERSRRRPERCRALGRRHSGVAAASE